MWGILVEFNALSRLINMGGSYDWECTTYTLTLLDPLTLDSPTERPVRGRTAVPAVKSE